jgi:hypothetical protein
MDLLNWPAEEVQPSLRAQQYRRRGALELLDKFGHAFPEVTYELFWESPTINAQAWKLGSARYVRVYGGLVRHSTVTKYGLAVMLAHETGHHLGGLPRDPAMPWMTWQGMADYWAASTGMPQVWGTRARDMTLRGASEIVKLHRLLAAQFDDDGPDLSPDCRYSILRSGALGQEMPICAQNALSKILRRDDGLRDDNHGLEG